MSTNTYVRINLKLGQALHRRFKVWCFENGMTLQAGLQCAVTGMMRDAMNAAAPAPARDQEDES
jgi:hypothetical protein